MSQNTTTKYSEIHLEKRVPPHPRNVTVFKAKFMNAPSQGHANKRGSFIRPQYKIAKETRKHTLGWQANLSLDSTNTKQTWRIIQVRIQQPCLPIFGRKKIVEINQLSAGKF